VSWTFGRRPIQLAGPTLYGGGQFLFHVIAAPGVQTPAPHSPSTPEDRDHWSRLCNGQIAHG